LACKDTTFLINQPKSENSLLYGVYVFLSNLLIESIFPSLFMKKKYEILIAKKTIRAIK